MRPRHRRRLRHRVQGRVPGARRAGRDARARHRHPVRSRLRTPGSACAGAVRATVDGHDGGAQAGPADGRRPRPRRRDRGGADRDRAWRRASCGSSRTATSRAWLPAATGRDQQVALGVRRGRRVRRAWSGAARFSTPARSAAGAGHGPLVRARRGAGVAAGLRGRRRGGAGRRLRGRRAGRAAPLPGARDRPRASAPSPRCRRLGAAPRGRGRGPRVVDADGLGALGPASSRRARCWRRASCPPCSPPTTASTSGSPHDCRRRRPPRSATGRRRPSLAARLGAVVLLKGSTTAVAAPDGQGFLVTSGLGPPCDGGHRRRALRRRRGVSGPGRRSVAGGRAGRPRARARRRPRLRRGPASPATCPSSSPTVLSHARG